jgi:hypothetical protein
MFPGCKNSTGLHWHETHTELLRVVQGVGCLERNGQPQIITKADGALVIDKGVRHAYWRADRDFRSAKDGGKGGMLEHVDERKLKEDFVLVESTDPVDRDKEIFFRHILSLLEEKGDGVLPALWVLWYFFVVMYGHDNYPVFVNWTSWFGQGIGRILEWVVAHFVLNVAVFWGWFAGLRSTYDEYTPVELRTSPWSSKSGKVD